jgi:hypothetical protein
MIRNGWVHTSSYAIDVAYVWGDGIAQTVVHTSTITVGDVVGGRSRTWQAENPAQTENFRQGMTFACEVRATKRRSDVIDPGAPARVGFQARAAELCDAFSSTPRNVGVGEGTAAAKALIEALRETATAPDDSDELERALDLWLAFEEAVEEHGSISGVANSVLQGAFEAHSILSSLAPQCALMPNGD